MSKKTQDITILTVGDKLDFDSYLKFHKERISFVKKGFKYATVSYRKLLKGIVPKIKTRKVIIFLFFPYKYWNKNIEHKGYKGLYGNISFSKEFSRFWARVGRILKNALPEKKVLFINNPSLCGLYRDKLSVIKKLDKHKIPQPRLRRISGIKEICRFINSGHSFFIKPRCGSMGKGVTFLSFANWKTNFIFKHNKIINRLSDYGWKAKDITGNTAFLKKLISNDVLVEEAVDSLVLKDYKLDLRVYSFFNKILYVYPRRNKPDRIVTNITQGGSGDSGILKLLPKEQVLRAKKIASQVSKVLKLNICGVDVMLERNLKNVFVIDVNVFPGFPKRKTFNLARVIARELAHLAQKERLHFEKSSHI